MLVIGIKFQITILQWLIHRSHFVCLNTAMYFRVFFSLEQISLQMALCHRVVESLERFSYLNFSSTLFVYSPKLHAKVYEWEWVVTWGLDLDRECKEVSVIQPQAKNWATLQAMNVATGSMRYIIGLFIDNYISTCLMARVSQLFQLARIEVYC